MTNRMCGCVVAALAALVVAGPARAGGLIVPGYSSQGQPRVGAFVAKADDPSALYYNPAGFARQKGTTVHFSLNLIDFDLTYQRAGAYEDPALDEPEPWTGDPYAEVSDSSKPALGLGGFQGIPSFEIATDLGGRTPFRFGFGIVTEQGFPERDFGAYDFEDPATPPPPQRYDIVSQEITAALPSAAVAYSAGKLDVGVRVSWGFASMKGTSHVWGLRDYEENLHKDAEFTVDVADWFVPAAQVGVLYHLSPAIDLGAQYSTARHVNAKGEGHTALGSQVGFGDEPDFIEPVTGVDAQCADGGTLAALKGCVDFEMPQTATIGGRYVLRDADGAERGDLEFDVVWEDWSSASDIRIVVDGKSGLSGLQLNETFLRHGFRDTYSFRLGGGYAIPVGKDTLIARAGVAYDTKAAPVSWTRVDIDGMPRTTFGAGVGYQTGRIRVDLGGGYVHEPEREVTSACNPSVDEPGCDGTGNETPVADRTAPDPVQPLAGPLNQVQSPFNSGTYKQRYVLVSLGLTYAF